MRTLAPHLFVLVALCIPACGDDASLKSATDAAPAIDASINAPTVTCNDADPALSLSAIEGLWATEADCGDLIGDPSVRCFDVRIEQPIDHSAPTSAAFSQRLNLIHRSCSAPTIVELNGYSNSDVFFESELGPAYEANYLIQEHRFVGRSAPKPADFNWQELTIENAAGDTHRIIESLRDHYTKNWITTGFSKGGVTALYHSYFYPNDTDGSVPYVAPLSLERIDSRYQVFMNTIGSDACREALRSYQVEVLNRRTTMIPLVRTKYGITELQADQLLEFFAARVEWAFWQARGANFCAQIPTIGATENDLWAFLNTILGLGPNVGGGEPVDSSRDSFVYSYEWLSEQGFAEQVGEHVAEKLLYPQVTMQQQYEAGAPAPLPAFDSSVNEATQAWVAEQARNTVLIYGENDPWSGGQVNVSDETSAKFFVPNANHGASIGALPLAERERALGLISVMMGRPPSAGREGIARAAQAAHAAVRTKHRQAIQANATATMLKRLRLKPTR